ncbi:hypothetical protein LshimejAT787_0200510 [Lyophyllum shimeji]|uniref:F-box domain-containing protein n=1 Tax=Lyophyllum shimeji TaxID=47721 RepID=A0A9P3PFF4_LYOSH|nr:hypothetical protein LshimejAT787_0200510 [Lyophyllum shimeji]
MSAETPAVEIDVDTETHGPGPPFILGNLDKAPSPISRIPPEILSVIFYYALPDPPWDFINEAWNSLDPTRAPSVLAEVCSSWRAVSLAQSELWSHILINLQTLSTVNMAPPTLSRLDLFLQRSGSHPLFIHYADRYAPLPEATDLFLLLLSHSRRWREVTFYVEFPCLQLMDRIRGNVPLLRALDISAYGANTFPVFRAFEEAPQLKNLLLDVGNPYNLSLPWSQLTSLACGLNVPAMLPGLPALLECVIRYNPYTPRYTPTRHVKLAKLVTDFTHPLDWLETPNLEYLRVLGPNRLTSSHLGTFIRRSSCALRSLCLHVIRLAEEDLHALLQSCPTLLRLQLSYCRIDWQALARRLAVHAPSLVPNLQHIALTHHEFRTNGDIINVLESRVLADHRAGVTCLRSAYLFFTQFSVEDETRLSALQDLGLQVVRGDGQYWI